MCAWGDSKSQLKLQGYSSCRQPMSREVSGGSSTLGTPWIPPHPPKQTQTQASPCGFFLVHDSAIQMKCKYLRPNNEQKLLSFGCQTLSHAIVSPTHSAVRQGDGRTDFLLARAQTPPPTGELLLFRAATNGGQSGHMTRWLGGRQEICYTWSYSSHIICFGEAAVCWCSCSSH